MEELTWSQFEVDQQNFVVFGSLAERDRLIRACMLLFFNSDLVKVTLDGLKTFEVPGRRSPLIANFWRLWRPLLFVHELFSLVRVRQLPHNLNGFRIPCIPRL